MAVSKDPTVTEGSGNVFADLGFSDAEELLAKAGLVSAISDIIKGRHLTQKAAAVKKEVANYRELGVSPPSTV